MSEFKGTPGPWDYWSGYNPYDKVEAQVTAEGGDIVIASYNHLIAEGEANAKLIAAAPDLLEAAITVLKGLNKRIDSAIESRRSTTPVFDGIAAMQDAITKATTNPDTGGRHERLDQVQR